MNSANRLYPRLYNFHALSKRISLLMVLLIWAWSAKAANILETQSGFELGYQFSTYRYDETVANQPFMNLSGNRYGLITSLTKAFRDADQAVWFTRLDGRANFGLLEYEGSGTQSDIPDYLWELRLVSGTDVPVASTMLSVYAGVGTRKLFNDLRGRTSMNTYGYRRESVYLYVPVGLIHRFALGQSSRIATTLEYDHLVEGRQTSYFTDADHLIDVSNRQRSGHGWRASLDYEATNWSIGIYWNMWQINDSDKSVGANASGVAYLAYEPYNLTVERGLQFRLRFH